MINQHPHLVFRITRDGLWLRSTLLRHQTTSEQLADLLHEPARVLNVGGREDSPHKIHLFDERGVFGLYDNEVNRILQLTITWLPETEDYKPRQAFTGDCWLNGVLLRGDMGKDELPLLGEICLKRFIGQKYSAFFDHFYISLRLARRQTIKGLSRKQTLASLLFSLSTQNLPKEFVAERIAEQP